MDATQLPVLTPEEGTQIGVRQNENSQWLPFRVTMVTKRYVHMVSPIQAGTRFTFVIGESGWQWQSWSECPTLLMPCPKCKGHGDILNKKTETWQSCPTCLGCGKVERDDPFAAPH